MYKNNLSKWSNKKVGVGVYDSLTIGGSVVERSGFEGNAWL